MITLTRTCQSAFGGCDNVQHPPQPFSSHALPVPTSRGRIPIATHPMPGNGTLAGRDTVRARPRHGATVSTRCGPALRSLPTAGAKPLTRQLQRPGQHRSHAGVERCACAPVLPLRASPAACWEIEFARRQRRACAVERASSAALRPPLPPKSELLTGSAPIPSPHVLLKGQE